jgi:hypothetical protein
MVARSEVASASRSNSLREHRNMRHRTLLFEKGCNPFRGSDASLFELRVLVSKS